MYFYIITIFFALVLFIIISSKFFVCCAGLINGSRDGSFFQNKPKTQQLFPRQKTIFSVYFKHGDVMLAGLIDPNNLIENVYIYLSGIYKKQNII